MNPMTLGNRVRAKPRPAAYLFSDQLHRVALSVVGNEGLVGMAQFIANMLGVRRDGVTVAATKLQKLGSIRYSRGHVTILDRHRLEHCCECYAVVKKKERLIGTRG
jgi:hypothetical protein